MEEAPPRETSRPPATGTPATGVPKIRVLEECAFNAWPALRIIPCNGWMLRFSEGYTRRANSANALFPAGRFAAVQHMAETLYPACGLPVVFRLSPLAGDEPDAVLARAGYRRADEALVMTARLDGPGGAEGTADPAVPIRPAADDAWCALHAEAAGTLSSRTHAAILSAIAPPAGFATLSWNGRPIACGMGVAERDVVGLFDIATLPAWRGHGAAKRIVSALLDWGRGRGAALAYLQVARDNDAALALYADFGFREAYRYHYRIRP